MNAKYAPWVLLAAIAIFAFDNIILKMAPNDYSPIEVMLFSFAIAAPIVTLIFRKDVKRLPDKKLSFYLFIVAGLYFLYNILNMQSLRFLSTDTATFFFSTSIVMVPIIDIFFGTRIRSDVALGILITMGGVWIMFTGTMSHNTLGIALSLLGAFVRSLYLISQNLIVKKVNSKESVVFLMWFALIFSLITTLIWDPEKLFHNDYSIEKFWPVIVFAFTSLVMATTMYVISQEFMTPTSVVVMFSMQIVFTMIIGALLPSSTGQHEDITIQMVIGALMIIVGNLVINIGWKELIQRIREKKAKT